MSWRSWFLETQAECPLSGWPDNEFWGGWANNGSRKIQVHEFCVRRANSTFEEIQSHALNIFPGQLLLLSETVTSY
jgi:hypothetical protein